ncbi:MAG: hypothetical protein ACK4NR_10445 [Micavibrio sp.]
MMTFFRKQHLLGLAVFSVLAFAADSYATETGEITAEAKNDVALSCDQIANEVVVLDRTIRTARDKKDSSDRAGTGVNVAQTVGSLLVGSLGGVVGIAAVGLLAGEAADEAGDDAAAIEEKAEERQNRLAGVFEGKGCEGELALTPEAEDKEEDVSQLEPASGTPTAPRRPRYND